MPVNGVLPTSALAFVLALSPLYGHAQVSAPQPKKPAATEELLLDEIPSVFGASRFDQLSTEAPASVTVITAEDIASHAWRNLSDLLQTVRGFYVIDDGVYPTIGARALGRPGDYNSKMLLVIDGHRINENMFDSFGPGSESMVDLRDVERIEIVRGPASSLYGTSAFFGVINVVTARGRATGGVKARLATESFSTRELTVAGGNRLPHGVDLYVSGSVRRVGSRDLYVPEFDTSNTRGWARGLDGDAREHANVRLSAGALTINGIVNHRTREYATGRYRVDFGVPGNSVKDNYGMIGAAYEPRLSANAALRLQASYNVTDYAGQYVYAGAPVSDFAHGRWVVLESQYTATMPHGQHLVLGAQSVRTPRQEQGVLDGSSQSFYDNTRQNSWAIFAQNEIRFSEHWLATAGLRMDAFTAFGKTLNPRAALIHTYGSGSAIKLLYGTAFRAPNNFERYYFGLGTLANPNLRPERIVTSELLVEHRIASSAKVNASVYRNVATRLIDLYPVNAAEYQYRNIGKVNATGIELEAQFEWRGTRANITQCFQRGLDVVDNMRLSNAPASLSTLDIVAPITRRINGAVEFRAIASRAAADRTVVPGFTVTNLVATGALLGGRSHVVAGVFNVFGVQYADPTSNQFVQSSIQQPGRTFRVSVELGSR
jgi:outer membrane receptor for ferrienterochelin and colicins